jgi:hypothetical protein
MLLRGDGEVAMKRDSIHAVLQSLALVAVSARQIAEGELGIGELGQIAREIGRIKALVDSAQEIL